MYGIELPHTEIIFNCVRVISESKFLFSQILCWVASAINIININNYRMKSCRVPGHVGLCHPLEIHVASQKGDVRVGVRLGKVVRVSVGHQHINDQLQNGLPPHWLSKKHHSFNPREVLIAGHRLIFKLYQI